MATVVQQEGWEESIFVMHGMKCGLNVGLRKEALYWRADLYLEKWGAY